MAYYKGSLKECKAYNELVIKSEKYKSPTKNWDTPHLINGSYYIQKNENYTSKMDLVKVKPKVKISFE